MRASEWRPRGFVGALLLVLAATAGPAEAGAQVSVTSVRPLEFGELVPGAPERVTPDDAWRRGEVRLDGTGTLDIRMLLPTALQAASGAQVPLLFGPADGRVELMRASRPIYFDPAAGTSVKIAPGQTGAWIHLGGQASPAANQAAGSYGATVVVVVTRTDT